MALAKYKPPHIPDFKKVVSTIRQIAPAMALELIREFAGDEVKLFRKEILAQDFPAFKEIPLSAKWLARKASANADLRTMLATHHYIDKIRVFTQQELDGSVTVYVGFAESDMAQDLKGNLTDFPLYRVAAVQEYGSAKANIPPRPHWGPHQKKMAGRAVDVRKEIAETIVKKLRAKLNFK